MSDVDQDDPVNQYVKAYVCQFTQEVTRIAVEELFKRQSFRDKVKEIISAD